MRDKEQRNAAQVLLTVILILLNTKECNNTVQNSLKMNN